MKKDAVLLSEDDWLSQIYPDQIQSFDDYVRLSGRLRPIVGKLVEDFLRTGTNVVMDFPANTVRQRIWFLGLCARVEAEHEMIYLRASNEICLRHLSIRRQVQPERAAFDTEEMFIRVTQHFEPPSDKEGVNFRVIEVRR